MPKRAETPQEAARRRFYEQRRAAAKPVELNATHVYDLLRFAVVRVHDSPAEMRLPPEEALAAQLGTTRSAVRVALERLSREGILQRGRRVGTRLNGEFSRQDFVGVVPSVMYEGRGHTSRMRQIGARTAVAPAFLRNLLGHEVESVAIREEVGTVDDEPIYLRVSYYVGGLRDPEEVLRTFNSQVYEGFDRPEWQLPPFRDVFHQVYGEHFGRCEVKLTATACDELTAERLGVPVGTAMMLRERLSFSHTDRLTIVCFTHFRSDRVVFTFDSRDGAGSDSGAASGEPSAPASA